MSRQQHLRIGRPRRGHDGEHHGLAALAGAFVAATGAASWTTDASEQPERESAPGWMGTGGAATRLLGQADPRWEGQELAQTSLQGASRAEAAASRWSAWPKSLHELHDQGEEAKELVLVWLHKLLDWNEILNALL